MAVYLIDFEPGLIYPPDVIGFGKLKVENKTLKVSAIDSANINTLKLFYESINQNVTIKENHFDEEFHFVQNENQANAVSIPVKTFIMVYANEKT